MSEEKHMKRVAFGEAVKDETGEIHEVEYGAKAANVICSNGKSVDVMMREMQGSRGEYGEPAYDKVVCLKEMALYVCDNKNHESQVNAEDATYKLKRPTKAAEVWGVHFPGCDPGRFNRFGLVYNFCLYEPYEENEKRLCGIVPIRTGLTFYNAEITHMCKTEDGTRCSQLAACKGNPFCIEEPKGTDIITFGPEEYTKKITGRALDLGKAVICNPGTGEKTITEMHVRAMYVKSMGKIENVDGQFDTVFSIDSDFTILFLDGVPEENTFPTISTVELCEVYVQQWPIWSLFQQPRDLMDSFIYWTGSMNHIFDHTGQYYDYAYLTEMEGNGGGEEPLGGTEDGT